MRTLSPQNLALYLGCDCEINAPRRSIETGQLQQIELTGYCIIASLGITRATHIDYVKPLLRKLESMTDGTKDPKDNVDIKIHFVQKILSCR